MAFDASAKPHVIDATDSNFEIEVVEKSKTVPVIVDFWAQWCGPCRALGPMLESLAEEFNGRFILAKVDIDQQRQLAARFEVSGVPMVMALVDGKIVSHFIGALPEARVRHFLETVCPSETTLLAKQAASLEESDPAQAIAIYRQVIEVDHRNTLAIAALADLLRRQGDVEEAERQARLVGEGTDGYNRARNVLARIGFQRNAENVEIVRARVESEPQNFEHRLRLGVALAAQEQWPEALEAMISAVEADKKFGAEQVKPRMVEIFNILGQQHELTNKFRSRLASALY